MTFVGTDAGLPDQAALGVEPSSTDDGCQEPISGQPQHCSFISFAQLGAMRIGKRQKHHAAVVGGRDLLAAYRCPGGVQRMQPNLTPPLLSRPSP